MMVMLPERWYTYSQKKTGKMRTAIGEFKHGGLRGKKYLKRYVTVQFEVERQQYWGICPPHPGFKPGELHTDYAWVDAKPEDFIHTETVAFDRKESS